MVKGARVKGKSNSWTLPSGFNRRHNYFSRNTQRFVHIKDKAGPTSRGFFHTRPAIATGLAQSLERLRPPTEIAVTGCKILRLLAETCRDCVVVVSNNEWFSSSAVVVSDVIVRSWRHTTCQDSFV
ncbi:hypothetical protein J6590_063633 [Homalodisca vitripennis]|nr:hypothetical protein J6590_063633 [Homalodisca vitripennis]